jgi:glycine/D-amino acid oxidase-like deaminating enzyme
MTQSTADVVICGAGIGGVAAAYHLAVKQKIDHVVLVDERPPLTLTSDKSTECYRNWWPGPGQAMVSFMNRSIDILEELARESGNIFNLNRRGYLYATSNPDLIEDMKRSAEESSGLGAGPLRCHPGPPGEAAYRPAPPEEFEDQPTGAVLILDPKLIREHFPYLSEETVAVLHPRRCGWLSAQQLGMYLLEQAQARGVQLIKGRVQGVELKGNRVKAVHVSQNGGESTTISTERFVNAAGPFVQPVARLMGVDLPTFSELHVKVAFNDHLGVTPREIRSVCPGRKTSGNTWPSRMTRVGCWTNFPPVFTADRRVKRTVPFFSSCGRMIPTRSRKSFRSPSIPIIPRLYSGA